MSADVRLRKPCPEHEMYDAHRIIVDRDTVIKCPGGTEPSTDELIAELERRGVVGFVEWVAG